MLKKIVIAVLAAAMFTGTGMFVAPRPAQADENSTIAIAAAAVVGLLTFDDLNRPYYVRDGYRCYVPDDVAGFWFQNYYGGWYGNYRNDWYYNRRQFAYEWNHRNYNGGPAYYGGGYRPEAYRGYNNQGYNGYNRPVNYGHPTQTYERSYQNYGRSYERPQNQNRGGYSRPAYTGGGNNYRGGNGSNNNDRHNGGGDHRGDGHGH